MPNSDIFGIMSMKDYIAQQILGYHLGMSEIRMALRSHSLDHYFLPLEDAQLDQYRLHTGQMQVSFPAAGVKLLLMVLNSLAHGEVPVLLPRYLEISIDEAAELLHISKENINMLIKEGLLLIPSSEKKQISIDHLVEYKKKKHLQQAGRAAHQISPQEIMSAYQAHPELKQFLHRINVQEFYILTRSGLEPLTMEIPSSIINLVLQILSKMTLANAIMTFPIKMYVNIEEAEILLRGLVSNIEDLIQEGIIPVHTEGTIILMKLKDILKFFKEQEQKSIDALKEMTNLWMEMETEDDNSLPA